LPFENRPVTILEKIFDLTDHLSGRELLPEHGVDCRAPSNGFVCDLMINRVLGVQAGDFIGIASIESLYPC